VRRIPSPLRAVLALAAALATVLTLAPAPALASHPILIQRFAADSGDSCRYGFTEGFLYWVDNHLPDESAVRISGAVTDRPTPADPGTACRDDRRYTAVTFRAFTGDVVVDQEIHRVNNGTGSVNFALEGRPGVPIDRVTITVCRELLAWTPTARYCGRTQTYYRFGVPPAPANLPS
jgi:hypothetical protein